MAHSLVICLLAALGLSATPGNVPDLLAAIR
jgi:hypothetical protein